MHTVILGMFDVVFHGNASALMAMPLLTLYESGATAFLVLV